MDMDEILEAFLPSWERANETDDTGRYLRPGERYALTAVWDRIVRAYEDKQRVRHAAIPSAILNVAMTRHAASQRTVRF